MKCDILKEQFQWFCGAGTTAGEWTDFACGLTLRMLDAELLGQALYTVAGQKLYNIYVYIWYSGNGGEEVHCFKFSFLNQDVSNLCGTFLEVLLQCILINFFVIEYIIQ